MARQSAAVRKIPWLPRHLLRRILIAARLAERPKETYRTTAILDTPETKRSDEKDR